MKEKFNNQIHGLPGDLPSTILVIFGATGDLALHYLLPTLLHMDSKGLLPKTFYLVCVGRRDFTQDNFLDFVMQAQSGKRPDKKALAHFAKHLIYYRGNFDEPKSFADLNKIIADRKLGGSRHLCYNRLYYFATAPKFFQPIAKILQREGLLMGCTEHHRTVRVLVEKPFGMDLASARSLNRLLLKFFSEDQIYRIDHYLGKETVQNLFVARFANDFLEPIWNSRYIDYVEISALEAESVGSRANFYNASGAMRDFVQNHLLNMLALVAMEQPNSLDSQDIRGQKVKVLRSLQLCAPRLVSEQVVRGQYRGYTKDVRKSSRTETFVAIKALLNLPRWKHVPFYLRTGKALKKKVTEISVHFKKQAGNLFVGRKRQPNVLTFRIQPDEQVRLQINNKIPGFGVRLHRGNLEFGYKANFSAEIPGAYERLLLDFMEGDQRLFIHSDEIEAAWKFIDNIRKHWGKVPLELYSQRSAGPKAAEKLIKRDGRQWWTK